MIDLTETEKLILMKIFSFEFESVKGVSSLMLEKRGVNRQTFTKHRDALVKEHLIEKESVKRKTWTYYKTTTLGKAVLFSSRILGGKEKIKEKNAHFKKLYGKISFFYNELPMLAEHSALIEGRKTEHGYDDKTGETSVVDLALWYAFDFIDIAKNPSRGHDWSWWDAEHDYTVTIKIPIDGFRTVFSLSYGYDESDMPKLFKQIHDILTFNFLLNLSNMKKHLSVKSRVGSELLKKPDLVKFHRKKLAELVRTRADLMEYCKI